VGTGTCEPIVHAPFAWQHGRRLWILDGRETEWVLAELVFEPLTCRYLEVRRASYRWPREAAGALLGRMLAGGESSAEEAAHSLSQWAARAAQASDLANS
jgi:hypothetical protein